MAAPGREFGKRRAGQGPGDAAEIVGRVGRHMGAATPAEGLRESAGLMVNYLYRLEDIEKNHEAYANQGEIAASSAVKKLLKNEGRRLLDMRLS